MSGRDVSIQGGASTEDEQVCGFCCYIDTSTMVHTYMSHTSFFFVYCTTTPLYHWQFTHGQCVSFAPSPFLFFLALAATGSKTRWESS